MNWLRHDFSLRSMKEGPGASRPRAFIMPPHPSRLRRATFPSRGRQGGEGFGKRILASTVIPPVIPTEPLPPLVIPTERSERRDLGTNSFIQEISPLGRFAPSVEMTRTTLASTVAQRRWLRRSTLASTIAKQNWQRNGFLPPPLRSNGGGGILPSGQNDERGGNSSWVQQGRWHFALWAK